MITELILSTIILSNPLRITPHLEPLERTEQYVHLTHSRSMLSDDSDISLMSFELTLNDMLISGYDNILSIPVYDSDDNLVTLINVCTYNKKKVDFNIADGRLFLADVSLLASRYDYSGIPLPALLAQAYTEGGAGKAGVYLKSNNLFGLKAGPAWDGFVYARDKGITYDSYETAKAHGAKDLFRAYMCMDDSIADYIDLVQTSSRYRSALGKNSKLYLKALVENGYGNPEMLSTWTQLIKLYKLDK